MLGDDGAGENNAEPELVNFRILFLLASSSLSLHLSSCRLRFALVLRFVFAFSLRLRAYRSSSSCRFFSLSSSLPFVVLLRLNACLPSSSFCFLTVVALHRLW